MPLSIFVSAVVSFLIALIGWHLLDRRANRTARRSEIFSSITPLISILNEIDKMAEEHLFDFLDGNMVESNAINKKQIFTTKSLSKIDLFRTRLDSFSDKGVGISSQDLIALKRALTESDIDGVAKYKSILDSTGRIHRELYAAFDRKFN